MGKSSITIDQINIASGEQNNKNYRVKKRGNSMKENLIKLTQDLAEAGYAIIGMEVEATDLVRIKFQGLDGLELVINEHFASIIEGNCSEKVVKIITKIVQNRYKIKDSLEADMFSNLLNAS